MPLQWCDQNVDAFHKDIQYTLEKLGKSRFGFERTAVSNFISKRYEGSVGPVLLFVLHTEGKTFPENEF